MEYRATCVDRAHQAIVSPCVGVCSTTPGDTTCRGCQRSDVEIRDWPGYCPEERMARMQALDGLREAVAGRYLRLVDEALLAAQLERHRVRVRPGQPALSRAVELLRVGRERIRDLARYGLARRAAAEGLSVSALHARIADELHRAAEARRLAQPEAGEAMASPVSRT